VTEGGDRWGPSHHQSGAYNCVLKGGEDGTGKVGRSIPLNLKRMAKGRAAKVAHVASSSPGDLQPQHEGEKKH